MKRTSLLLGLLGAVLLSSGCNPEGSTPTQANLATAGSDNPLLGSVTATMPITRLVALGTTKRVSDREQTVKGRILVGTFTAGDLEGTTQFTFNSRIDIYTHIGRIEGAMTITPTSVRGQPVTGSWSGYYTGRHSDGTGGTVEAGEFIGNGTGDLAGTAIRFSFNDGPSGLNTFLCTGEIREER